VYHSNRTVRVENSPEIRFITLVIMELEAVKKELRALEARQAVLQSRLCALRRQDALANEPAIDSIPALQAVLQDTSLLDGVLGLFVGPGHWLYVASVSTSFRDAYSRQHPGERALLHN
jgi:hypothetical protein